MMQKHEWIRAAILTTGSLVMIWLVGSMAGCASPKRKMMKDCEPRQKPWFDCQEP